jgi:hypothetical protein
MQIATTATAALVGASAFTLAMAQTPEPLPPGYVADAQSTYDPREVASARQAYRQSCQRYQSREFCECLSAGIAQGMPPRLVLQARTGIGDRIARRGSDASVPIYRADARSGLDDPDGRIVEVEGHYANACAELRR